MAVAMLALSIIILEIFTAPMWGIFILTIKNGEGQSKYANGNAVCYFIFVGNNNVCPICYHLRDIRSQNVHNLDLDL